MVEIWIPYGSTEIPLRVSTESLLGVHDAPPQNAATSSEQNLRKTLDQTMPSLQSDAKVTLAVNIGPVGSYDYAKTVLGSCLSILQEKGCSASRTKVIFGPSWEMQPVPSLLQGIRDLPVQPIVHDPNASPCTQVTVDGQGIGLNSEFVESDFKIVLSEVRPDVVTGLFSWPEAILPGLASTPSSKTIVESAIPSDLSEYEKGKLALSKKIETIGKAAKPDLALCWRAKGIKLIRPQEKDRPDPEPLEPTRVLNSTGEIIVAGAGGQRYDQTFYSALDSFALAFPKLAEGKVGILVAECSSGIGPIEFQETCRRTEKARFLALGLRRKFSLPTFKAYLALMVSSIAKIHLVSTLPENFVSSALTLRPSNTANAALSSALRTIGKTAKVTVIRDCASLGTCTA